MNSQTVNWRNGKGLVVFELALVIGLFAADAKGLIPFSKTPFLLLVVVLSLLVRRTGFKGIGFRRFGNWPVMLLLGVLGGVVIEVIELYLSQPFLVHVLHQRPDLSDLGELRGNIELLLVYFGLIWTLGAFGEEIVYRGYLMGRISDLLGGGKGATFAGLLIMSVAFGFAHGYQGAVGIVDEGFMGLLLGLMFLGAGRCLWVPIIAHGVQDTIDVVLLYSGHYPMPGP